MMRIKRGYICRNCGKVIIGKPEYVKTQRGEEFYFCKDMQCFKDNKSNSLN